MQCANTVPGGTMLLNDILFAGTDLMAPNLAQPPILLGAVDYIVLKNLLKNPGCSCQHCTDFQQGSVIAIIRLSEVTVKSIGEVS